MPSDPRRKRLIVEALQGRLAEVRASLLGAAADAIEQPSPAEDPEEQLRVVMVRLWPSTRRAGADLTAFRHLLDGLLPIEATARGDDLRFLDAWNNAYETLEAHPDWRQSPPAQSFLSRYAEILRDHVERTS